MSGPAPFVTICLTTISGRVEGAARTIRSLLAQDHPAFAVRLHLSREPFLLDEGVPEAPEPLAGLAAEDSRFSIRWTPNIGPYRKIIPFLIETRGRQALVATADDDTVYPSDWLSGLVVHHRLHRCVICYRGHFMARAERRFLPYRRWMTNGVERNPDLFVIPTGKDGVLYDTRLLHPRVIDYPTALRIAPTADDLWLKWHTAAADVPTYVINPDYAVQTFNDFGLQDGLYAHFNRDGGNTATVRRLEAYALEKLGFDFAARF